MSPGTLRVIHLGVGPEFRPLRVGEEEALRREVAPIVDASSRYLLSVGNVSTRRHLPALLESLTRLRANDSELSLVVGPNADGLPLDPTSSNAKRAHSSRRSRRASPSRFSTRSRADARS